MYRFSLSDKISLTIVSVGVFGLLLVLYISDSYKQFAYQHHAQSIQHFAYIKIDDLTAELKANSLDLALSIKKGRVFNRDAQRRDSAALTHQLDDQFYQYFVTAGVLDLLKLYVLDNDFTLLSTSTEGIDTGDNNELICPTLSQIALKRYGSGKLQNLARSCIYQGHPVFAVITPFGGLKPRGYIQVVTDLAYGLKNIEHALAMPVQLQLLDGEIFYQSSDWQRTQDNRNYLNVELPIHSDDNGIIMTISMMTDMSNFNQDIKKHRNQSMAAAFISTALAIFIGLWLVRRSSIPPLAKIHDVLEEIHLPAHGGKNQRLLFEQLLEQIILLRKKAKTGFSVIIIDLTRFEEINTKYGEHSGDQLLLEVEDRLSSILRESDLISWVGTDTPGHKLLPDDTKTRYRATIARLGGDEFGLLLPSAATENQAVTAAERIINTLNKPFNINGHDVEIQCRVGISLYPQHGEDEKQLIRYADKAMFEAKSQGKTIFVYTPDA